MSKIIVFSRPAQLAELSRNEFDPELFSRSAYVKFFCDIRDRSAVFIAPKASAEGACILSKMGYCYGVSAGIWVIHTGPKSGVS